MPKRRRRRRRVPRAKGGAPYTKGEVNKLIDDLIHPLKKTHWAFILIDEAFHMINEGEIAQSLAKFAEYSLPELVRIFLKKKES